MRREPLNLRKTSVGSLQIGPRWAPLHLALNVLGMRWATSEQARRTSGQDFLYQR